MVNLERLKYSGWDYPDAVIAIGWTIFALGISQFPIYGIVALFKKKKSVGSLLDSLKAVFKPSRTWGPAEADKFSEWVEYKREAKEKRIKQAETLGHSPLKQKLFILLGRYR